MTGTMVLVPLRSKKYVESKGRQYTEYIMAEIGLFERYRKQERLQSSMHAIDCHFTCFQGVSDVKHPK